jgi:hypothetical protein
MADETGAFDTASVVFKLHWSKKMFQAEVAERIYVSIVTQLLD